MFSNILYLKLQNLSIKYNTKVNTHYLFLLLLFQTMCANSYTQQHLESDLVETKQQLLEVQAQLQLAEKELESKLNQTAAFKNMKQMLATKNEQIKSLRQQLNKYEETNEED
ncbi:unnamed protein product [Larinioides sclopetarius]|uniref:Leucine zipper transcription factor-like protein 1 n=1 Tax=Larinioides sclopetarius TaxID=280406 RepID=A0AAV2BHK0_9ARAC